MVLTREMGLCYQPNWGRDPRRAEEELFFLATLVETVDTKPDLYLGQMGSLQFQIFVNNLSGKAVRREVGSEDKNQAMKEKLFEKDGVLVDLQKLVFLGQLLDSEKWVKDYGIQRGSTVYLVMSVWGRMQNPDRPILMPVHTPMGLEGDALKPVDPMVMDPPILDLTAPTPESTPVLVPELTDLSLVVAPMGGVVTSQDENQRRGQANEEVERHKLSTPEASQSTKEIWD